MMSYYMFLTLARDFDDRKTVGADLRQVRALLRQRDEAVCAPAWIGSEAGVATECGDAARLEQAAAHAAPLQLAIAQPHVDLKLRAAGRDYLEVDVRHLVGGESKHSGVNVSGLQPSAVVLEEGVEGGVVLELREPLRVHLGRARLVHGLGERVDHLDGFLRSGTVVRLQLEREISEIFSGECLRSGPRSFKCLRSGRAGLLVSGRRRGGGGVRFFLLEDVRAEITLRHAGLRRVYGGESGLQSVESVSQI